MTRHDERTMADAAAREIIRVSDEFGNSCGAHRHGHAAGDHETDHPGV